MEIPNLKVVLNPHAKRVTPGVIREIEELVPPRSLILPQSIEDNDRIAEKLLGEGLRRLWVGATEP